jgi:hypothetical protein
MRSFIFRVAGITSLCLAFHFSVILLVRAPLEAEYWVKALIDVKLKLADTSPSPRLVLVGGSSTLFGLDAEQISLTTGAPTLNLGLHAGLPLGRILAVADEAVRDGDTIVLALEPEYYECTGLSWNTWRTTNAITWDRPYFDTLPLIERIQAVYSTDDPSLSAKIIGTKVISLISERYESRQALASASSDANWSEYLSGRSRTDAFAYSAFNVDRYGDMRGNHASKYTGVGEPVVKPDGVCPSVATLLKQFVAKMSQRRIQVVVVGTAYLVEQEPAQGWEQAEARWRSDLEETNAVVLGQRNKLFMTRDRFFNTKLHLNDVGRQERTALLIADLMEAAIIATRTSQVP